MRGAALVSRDPHDLGGTGRSVTGGGAERGTTFHDVYAACPSGLCSRQFMDPSVRLCVTMLETTLPSESTMTPSILGVGRAVKVWQDIAHDITARQHLLIR